MKTSELLIGLLALAASVSAVRYGDEQFGVEVDGLFYVFSPQEISVVNANTLTKVKSITTDHNGQPFDIRWGDVVYMEQAGSDRYYIFANEMNEHTDPGAVATHSFVTVIDTVQHSVVDRVRVGGRPVHLYGVWEKDEMWTHSDNEAEFDVIHLDDVTKLHAAKVPALVNADERGNHGKLLVDPDLFPLGYATNTGENYLFEVDFDAKAKTNQFSWADLSDCRGSHAISYSDKNKHVYIEGSSCSVPTIMEFDTVNKRWVGKFEGSTGALYETPDEEFVVAAYKSGNKAFVFQPGGTGATSSVRYEVEVPGNPGSPTFFPKDTCTDCGFHDHLAFFPLTRNTLTANIDAVAAMGDTTKDVTSDDYYSKPHDCQYDASGRKLARDANGVQITPNCGMCSLWNRFPGARAPASEYDAGLSGFAWVDLKDVVNAGPSGRVTAKFISAGAIRQGYNYSYSVECAYGRTYRTAKRGGNFIATHADFPAPAVYFVDGRTQTLHGHVSVAEGPTRVAWAPTRPRTGGGETSGAIAVGRGRATAAAAVVAAAAALALALVA